MTSSAFDEIAIGFLRRFARPLTVAFMILLGLLLLDVTFMQSAFVAIAVTVISIVGIGARRLEQIALLVFCIGVTVWLAPDIPAFNSAKRTIQSVAAKGN